MIYSSTKTYNEAFSTVFRQWRADSHCKYLHGYALSVSLTFRSRKLDVRNWVVDFGGMGELKAQLVRMFDHNTLVARDDPELEFLVEANERGVLRLHILDDVGCEAVAREIASYVCHHWLPSVEKPGRVWLHKVTVCETLANMATVTLPEPGDNGSDI